MKVVIVEDNGGIAEMLKAVLRVHDVASPAITPEALFDPRLWSDADVGVIDLLLGDMKGRDVLIFLGRKAPHVRRILITAAPSAVDAVCIEESEAILEKPFEVTNLEREVALGRRR